MNRTHAIRTIHACARAAGLDEDAQRDVYEREAGGRSLRSMSDQDLYRLAVSFKAMAPKRPGFQKREEKPHVRKILKVWGILADAGVVAKGAGNWDGRRAALNAFIQGKTFREKWGEELTHYRFISVARARDVIEALKAIAKREGVRGVK